MPSTLFKSRTKQAKNNPSGVRRVFTLNIGTIVFGLLFIYILISILLYVTATHVRSFQVTAGPLARNAEYTGIAVYTENVLEAPELARLFREVNRPNLRLLYDSQNYRQMANRDALPVFVSAASLVGDFLHVKDGDEKLGDRPLGEGTCGLEKQLEAIVRSGFAGSYILENKFQTLDNVAECAARLDDLLDAAEARVHDEA